MGSGVFPPNSTTCQLLDKFKMPSMQAAIDSMMMESMSKTWADTLIATTVGDFGSDLTTRLLKMDNLRLLIVR